MTDISWDEIEDVYNEFKKEVRYKKLSEYDWHRLNQQFIKTPQVHKLYKDVSYYPSGEHYRLNMLLRELGYHAENRVDVTKVAEELLSMGYYE